MQLSHILRQYARPVIIAGRAVRQWLGDARFRAYTMGVSVPRDSAAVSYLSRRFPAPPATRWELVRGGAVKMTCLAEALPHSARRFSLLYAASSVLHPHAATIMRAAKQKGIKIVWNQNGVYYQAWYGPGWERPNARMAQTMHLSDYVIYQSQFCKFSADKFLGAFPGPSSILYNPVDIHHLCPAHEQASLRQPVLLTLGARHSGYRLECALQALASVKRTFPKARLIVPGVDINRTQNPALRSSIECLIDDLALRDSVTLLPPYTQEQAPAIFNQAHILVHPQYNDASPTVVAEAMACGLPVAYSASGGVPELVGSAAGVGVPAPLDWQELHPPDPEALADAVLQVMEHWQDYSRAARQRAVDCFSLDQYVAHHQHIFEQLATRRSASLERS
jgi:glycosyltransferase involved in cell wall biosynthesis